VVKIEPKVNDKRKKLFYDWLDENKRVLFHPELSDKESMIVENVCSESVIVRKNIGGKKRILPGENYKLEPGDDIEIEGKLFTVDFRPEE